MSKAAKRPAQAGTKKRIYEPEFRREAVQMMLDGHSASSVAERLGLKSPNLLYTWKRKQITAIGPVATSLEARVQQLEAELLRVEQERDILKKALAIFGRHV
jgi:transposase